MTAHPPHEWGRPPPTGSTEGPTAPGEASVSSPPAEPERATAPPLPPRRQKKPKIWPWVLGLIVAVLTLITGCVGLVVTLVRAPIGAANEFVALVDDGEYELAYNSLCFATRAELSQEEFTEHFSASEDITGYTLSSASWVLGELTTVSGTVEINDVPRSISISLARENDQWRVCEYDLIQ